MNREIEFRGINTLSKEFIYGDLVKYSENQWSIWALKNGGHEVYLIDTKTIGQYTGLKDRNGVKIFEGDVLKWVSSNPFSKGEIRKVQVYYIQAQFWCKGTIGVYLAELLSAEKCEVIGNIHSNPELINC